mmetsp:Transcript_20572/g.29733  ORF Transcript_20572/g.29733 Transcript_20572/m.29733 type:complete len:257 (-) Transcript_20572:41-811(-)
MTVLSIPSFRPSSVALVVTLVLLLLLAVSSRETTASGVEQQKQKLHDRIGSKSLSDLVFSDSSSSSTETTDSVFLQEKRRQLMRTRRASVTDGPCCEHDYEDLQWFTLTESASRGCIKSNGVAGIGSGAVLAKICDDVDEGEYRNVLLNREDYVFMLVLRSSPSNETLHCLQGGYGGKLRDGSKLRVFPCDDSSLLQRFVLDGESDIRPVTNSNLCLVHRGDTANLDEDPIIFKKCTSRPLASRLWWAGSGFFDQD